MNVSGDTQSGVFNNAVFICTLAAVDEQIFCSGFFKTLIILRTPAVAIEFLFTGASRNGMK